MRTMLLMLALAGCAEESETLPKVRGPDGKTWWELECTTTFDCREELSTQCPHGYQTRDEEVQRGPLIAAHTPYATVVSQTESRTTLFRCRGDK